MSEIAYDAGERKLSGINFKEVWNYRALLWTFSYRDLKVKYAKTSLGILWSIFQPLITLSIFIFIFGRAIKINTGDVPYSLFAISGMLAWFYFAAIVNQGGNSVISAGQLVKKIYFPKFLLPLSKSIVSLVDFGVIFVLFLGLALYHHYPISRNIIYLPLFFILLYFTAMTFSLIVNTLVIRFKDLQILIPFLVQIGLYATPVAYPARLFPQEYIFLYSANPMVGIVEGFRWCLLGEPALNISSFYVLFMMPPLFFVASYFFRKTTDNVNDLI